MRSLIAAAALLFAALTPALAQQVPNPMPITGGPQVAPRFGYLQVESPVRAAGDLTDMALYRDADYAGGTHGMVNTSASFGTTVRAGTIPHEWNLYATLDNYGTIADGGENTAFYSQTHKRSTGFTWAALAEIRDYNTASPSKGAIALELNVVAGPGPDVTGNRTALNIYNGAINMGVDTMNMRSDIVLDGAFAIRNNGVEASGQGSSYWYNLVAATNSALYLYGVNLVSGSCDNSIPGTPGAQFIGPNFQVDCLGDVTVSNSKTIDVVAAGASQGWLRLLSSSGTNFIESGLTNAAGSGAELSFTSYNAMATYLLTGPNGTTIGSGVRQGAGTINVQNGYYIGATAGVNCAAGAFAPATAIVTKGLVTKCN